MPTEAHVQQYAATELRADREVVPAAVRHHAWFVRRLVRRCRERSAPDSDVVLAAVRAHHGVASKHAAAKLRAVVLAEVARRWSTTGVLSTPLPSCVPTGRWVGLRLGAEGCRCRDALRCQR
jgi:hypothetical protein